MIERVGEASCHLMALIEQGREIIVSMDGEAVLYGVYDKDEGVYCLVSGDAAEISVSPRYRMEVEFDQSSAITDTEPDDIDFDDVHELINPAIAMMQIGEIRYIVLDKRDGIEKIVEEGELYDCYDPIWGIEIQESGAASVWMC